MTRDLAYLTAARTRWLATTSLLLAAACGGSGPAAGDPVDPRASTTTTLARSSGNDPSTAGDSVTFVATVAGAAATPAGTVQFRDGAVDLGAPVTLVAGAASLTTSSLAGGSHTLTAVYSGDGSYRGSTSAGVSHAVNKLTTTTWITHLSGSNPSPFGSPVAFIATVSGPSAITPTGTIQFMDNVAELGAPVALVDGSAVVTTSALAVGNHVVTAMYSGDAFFGASGYSVPHDVN